MTKYVLYTYGPLASYCDVRTLNDRYVGSFMVNRRSRTVRVISKKPNKYDRALARAINRKQIDRSLMSCFNLEVDYR